MSLIKLIHPIMIYSDTRGVAVRVRVLVFTAELETQAPIAHYALFNDMTAYADKRGIAVKLLSKRVQEIALTDSTQDKGIRKVLLQNASDGLLCGVTYLPISQANGVILNAEVYGLLNMKTMDVTALHIPNQVLFCDYTGALITLTDLQTIHAWSRMLSSNSLQRFLSHQCHQMIVDYGFANLPISNYSTKENLIYDMTALEQDLSDEDKQQVAVMSMMTARVKLRKNKLQMYGYHYEQTGMKDGTCAVIPHFCSIVNITATTETNVWSISAVNKILALTVKGAVPAKLLGTVTVVDYTLICDRSTEPLGLPEICSMPEMRKGGTVGLYVSRPFYEKHVDYTHYFYDLDMLSIMLGYQQSEYVTLPCAGNLYYTVTLQREHFYAKIKPKQIKNGANMPACVSGQIKFGIAYDMNTTRSIQIDAREVEVKIFALYAAHVFNERSIASTMDIQVQLNPSVMQSILVLNVDTTSNDTVQGKHIQTLLWRKQENLNMFHGRTRIHATVDTLKVVIAGKHAELYLYKGVKHIALAIAGGVGVSDSELKEAVRKSDCKIHVPRGTISHIRYEVNSARFTGVSMRIVTPYTGDFCGGTDTIIQRSVYDIDSKLARELGQYIIIDDL